MAAMVALAHCGSFSSTAPAPPVDQDAATAGPDASSPVDADSGPAGQCQVLYQTSFDPFETFDTRTSAEASLSTDGKLVARVTAPAAGRASAFFSKSLPLEPGLRTVTASYALTINVDKGAGVPGCRLSLQTPGGVGAVYFLYYEDPELYIDVDLQDGGAGPTQVGLGGFKGRSTASVSVTLELADAGLLVRTTLGPLTKGPLGPLALAEAPNALLLECGVVRFSSTAAGVRFDVEMDDLRVEACR
jgi:hypothetical protein